MWVNVCVPLTVTSSSRSALSSATYNNNSNNNTSKIWQTKWTFTLNSVIDLGSPKLFCSFLMFCHNLVCCLISHYGCLCSSYHVHISRKGTGTKNKNTIRFEDIPWKFHITLSSHWSQFIHKATTIGRGSLLFDLGNKVVS